MKAIPLDRRRDVRLMQMLAFQLGMSAGAEVIDQLANQLRAARQERAEAIARFRKNSPHCAPPSSSAPRPN